MNLLQSFFNNEHKKDENTTEADNLKPIVNKAEKKRTFIPGSEWLYYKIYCGIKTTDKILIKTVKPLVDRLKKAGLIEKWFFIKYEDPDTHIRLRLYNNNIEKNSEVSKIVYQYLKPLMDEGVISKVLNDTYIRELERYGSNNIENTEEYFEFDSRTTLDMLEFSEREKNDTIKWLYALRSTDILFESFGYNLNSKLIAIEGLKDAYFNEHGGQKELKLQMDKKFRKMRPQIESFLDGKLDNDINLYEITALLKLKGEMLQLLAPKIICIQESGTLGVALENLLGSYSHLSLSRMFKSKQRIYEMLIYDMLYRYYKSKLARMQVD